MYVTAIVLAAGKGTRLKNRIPKPLILLNARPVIAYSLETLQQLPFIKDIIVVARPANRERLLNSIARSGIHKVRCVVKGGRRRQDSLGEGLKFIDARSELVLIHDSARPFVDKKSIIAAVREAARCGAAVVGVPVKNTIKKVAKSQCPNVPCCGMVKETLDRDTLWEIQTPQVFRKDLLVRAFKKFGRRDVTDDAMLVEKLGCRVCVVRGSYCNIKITTPEDLLMAEAIVRKG